MGKLFTYRELFNSDEDARSKLTLSYIKFKDNWTFINSFLSTDTAQGIQCGNKNLSIHFLNDWENIDLTRENVGNVSGTNLLRVNNAPTRQYKWGIATNTFHYRYILDDAISEENKNTDAPQIRRNNKNNHIKILQSLENKYPKLELTNEQNLFRNLAHSEGLLYYKTTLCGYINKQNQKVHLLPRFERYPLIKEECEKANLEIR